MKEELRRTAAERARSLAAEERTERAGRIAHNVWSVPEIASAGALLVYASVPGEVPTGEIIDEARRRGIVTVFPRCVPGARDLTLHPVGSAELLVPGSFGIPEPDPSCPALGLGAVDAALIPGLAWDRDGDRLGRGAGYYDRLLGQPGWRGFVCGLFFDVQEADRIPADPWDVRMDAVVTESGVWRPGGR
jgi:5-formyltetrahydrofolate cyclo-ligase